VQTRYLNPGTGPKYDNPAATLATNPRLAWTKSVDAGVRDWLVVCEGIPDGLTAAAMGMHCVATLGSQSCDKSVVDRIAAHAFLNRLSVELVSDNDDAGTLWAQRLQAGLSDVGVTSTNHVAPDAGRDLNDWFVDARTEHDMDEAVSIAYRSMFA
jgi:hypothetical protein